MKLPLLVRFYPARWRQRYGEEIADLLATEPPSVPRAVDMVRGLIDAHLHPELVDSAFAAVPPAGERSAEMRTHGTGTVARLARVAMLTVLIGLTPVATGAVGYYVGRSQVSPVAEPASIPQFCLGGASWTPCGVRYLNTGGLERNSPLDTEKLQRVIRDDSSFAPSTWERRSSSVMRPYI
jgi:hypothetical protein